MPSANAGPRRAPPVAGGNGCTTRPRGGIGFASRALPSRMTLPWPVRGAHLRPAATAAKSAATRAPRSVAAGWVGVDGRPQGACPPLNGPAPKSSAAPAPTSPKSGSTHLLWTPNRMTRANPAAPSVRAGSRPQARSHGRARCRGRRSPPPRSPSARPQTRSSRTRRSVLMPRETARRRPRPLPMRSAFTPPSRPTGRP